ncbi:Flavoprotein MioC [Pseudoalteromonas luteoviolacea B = ATCC 29581]|nr:Flavoprotein MioC [Pseudoalteromonas luteoviolacea B = ATCC 29581]
MKHIEIVVGSQMGAAEYVAEQVEQALKQHGYDTTLHLQPQLDQLQSDTLLIVTSTYGAGDYPDNLVDFINEVRGSTATPCRYIAGIGVGDSSYDTFNYAVKNAIELFEQKQAKLLLPPLCIDVLDEALPEDTAEAWVPNLIDVLAMR